MTNVFLDHKDKGMNKKMKGKIGIIYLLVDLPRHKWTEERRNQMNHSTQQVSSFLQSAAREYHVFLSIRNFFIKVKFSHRIESNSDFSMYRGEILAQSGYTSVLNIRQAYMERFGLDDIAVCYLLPVEGRSYAHAESGDVRLTEYACIMRREGKAPHLTIIHEVCHLYGARDFYLTNELTQLALRHLGPSIMLDNAERIDSLTAYLIGWTEEPDSRAQEFLKKTDSITREELMQIQKECYMTGKGRYNYRSGAYYEGDLIDGVPEGYGIIHFKSGSTAEGFFHQWNPEGQVMVRYSNSEVQAMEYHEGNYLKVTAADHRNGKDRYQAKDGSYYEGELVNGTANGWGIWHYKSGRTMEGRFHQWKPEGRMKIRHPNRKVEEAEYRDGIRIP